MLNGRLTDGEARAHINRELSRMNMQSQAAAGTEATNRTEVLLDLMVQRADLEASPVVPTKPKMPPKIIKLSDLLAADGQTQVGVNTTR